MGLSTRIPEWRDVDVAGESWHETDLQWDPHLLLDLLDVTAACESRPLLAPALVKRIVPSGNLRSIETVGITLQGGVRRGTTDRPDSELLAWTVACLWSDADATPRLRANSPHARVRERPGGADGQACIPLTRASTLHEVVAVSIEAPDARTAIDCLSQLTLVGRVGSLGPPGGRHDDEDRAGREDPDAVLTQRQHVVLEAMARGLTNGQIAHLINFSESTVRMESMSIYRYFGVHSRLDAVEAAKHVGELPRSTRLPGHGPFDV